MIIETQVYRLLSADAKLNALLDKYRGKAYGNGFKQGIFTYDIPEKPTNLKKVELAPFMRIVPTFEGPAEYADDDIVLVEQRVIINFWCETAAQSDEIAKQLDEILERNKFERYTANEKPRFKDSDIGLLMNVRKYRFFDWQKQKENEE